MLSHEPVSYLSLSPALCPQFSVTNIVQKLKGNFSREGTIQILQTVTQFLQKTKWHGFTATVENSSTPFYFTLMRFHSVHQHCSNLLPRPVTLFSLIHFLALFISGPPPCASLIFIWPTFTLYFTEHKIWHNLCKMCMLTKTTVKQKKALELVKCLYAKIFLLLLVLQRRFNSHKILSTCPFSP